MKVLAPIVILTLVCCWSTQAQPRTYQFEQLDSLQTVEDRLVAVFIHTDWCQYCQKMKHVTFNDEEITDILNESFYFISMNAEGNKDILFGGQTFSFKPTGNKVGVHELATLLGTVEGKLSYPTLCFFNSNREIVFQYDQFISASSLEGLLNQLNR